MSGEADPEETREVQAALDSLPDFPDEAVVGIMERVDDGAVFFEGDNLNMGDIDVYLRDTNCSFYGNLLAYDNSHDVKSMVRVGTQGAGKRLCIWSYAAHSPPAETRRLHVFAYYSGGTPMR
jgi:hypothetical protein